MLGEEERHTGGQEQVEPEGLGVEQDPRSGVWTTQVVLVQDQCLKLRTQ